MARSDSQEVGYRHEAVARVASGETSYSPPPVAFMIDREPHHDGYLVMFAPIAAACRRPSGGLLSLGLPTRPHLARQEDFAAADSRVCEAIMAI